jgi:hypothetical protein
MRIVLPVTKHDSERFVKRNNLLLKFGGLKDHSAIILHTPSVRDVANAEAERLRPLLRELQVVQTKSEPDFPAAVHESNYIFYSAVMNLLFLENKESWLYFEADAAPTDYGWATTLSNAQKAAGYAFFGNVVRLPYIDPSTNKIFYPNDEHMMMAVGMYPPGLGSHKSESYGPIVDLGKPYPMNPTEPSDVYLRGEMKRMGWFNTDLIADQWNTDKYKRVEGGFECSPRPFHRPVRDRGGFVPKKALVIHGCKDDSLYDLLADDGMPSFAPEVSETPPVQTASSGEQLTERQGRIKDALLMKLQKSGVRANNLAAELNIEQKTLEEELLRIGYRVIKPAGWIKPL